MAPELPIDLWLLRTLNICVIKTGYDQKEALYVLWFLYRHFSVCSSVRPSLTLTLTLFALFLSLSYSPTHRVFCKPSYVEYKSKAKKKTNNKNWWLWCEYKMRYKMSMILLCIYAAGCSDSSNSKIYGSIYIEKSKRHIKWHFKNKINHPEKVSLEIWIIFHKISCIWVSMDHNHIYSYCNQSFSLKLYARANQTKIKNHTCPILQPWFLTNDWFFLWEFFFFLDSIRCWNEWILVHDFISLKHIRID